MDLRNGFDIRRYIRTIPDYPKPGIQFRDITTLLANKHAFRAAVDELMWPFLSAGVDYVAGIEARGFILGGAIAHELGLGFVPIRKKGKLPWKTLDQEYQLEYGKAVMEIHEDAIEPGESVLLVDDLLATGGTAAACAELVQRAGGSLCGFSFVAELAGLEGRRRLPEDLPVESLLIYP